MYEEWLGSERGISHFCYAHKGTMQAAVQCSSGISSEDHN